MTDFIRVIITLTSVCALISLLYREWLYTFWKDYKSHKEFYFKLIEMQKKVMDKDSGKYEKGTVKESSFEKFIENILSLEFFIQVLILIPHPIPYDVEYTFDIIDMLSTKS